MNGHEQVKTRQPLEINPGHGKVEIGPSKREKIKSTGGRKEDRFPNEDEEGFGVDLKAQVR